MKCDFCTMEAKYDARIPLLATWAYVCEVHFRQFECSLGTGKGQLLEEAKSNDNQDTLST